MVQEAAQHGGDGRGVAEQLSPVFDGSVGSHLRAGVHNSA